MVEESNNISRRKFFRGAVAVGGTAALAACIDVTNDDSRSSSDPAQGITDRDALPDRQHAWNDYCERDEHGNIRGPRHHVVLLANYTNNGPVSATDRDITESALQLLEEAYEWSPDGLLFTVAYSPTYFDRYDEPLPDSIDVPAPSALADSEDPDLDTPDVVIHLASDHASVVLEVEQALFGEIESVNDVSMDVTVTDVLTRVERRTGFVGAGLPAENDTVSGVPDGAVPEDSPLFMGFASGFTANQASEDSVTITDGPFAGGTTEHISTLQMSLDQWYNQDTREQRISKMFSPRHTEQDLVEGVGNNLGSSSQIMTVDAPANTETDAFEKGVVGHAQKTAQARDENGAPRILRRDFDTTDGDRAGLYFLSLQESITDFVETRMAMFGTDVANVGGVGTTNNNGILQYITTLSRGNYLIPPREIRSFPEPVHPAQSDGFTDN